MTLFFNIRTANLRKEWISIFVIEIIKFIIIVSNEIRLFNIKCKKKQTFFVFHFYQATHKRTGSLLYEHAPTDQKLFQNYNKKIVFHFNTQFNSNKTSWNNYQFSHVKKYCITQLHYQVMFIVRNLLVKHVFFYKSIINWCSFKTIKIKWFNNTFIIL